jgi:hypothetical protein
MEFPVLQSCLIRIQIPNDNDLFAWSESLFLIGIGYWNSMGYLTAEIQRKIQEKTFATLCGFAVPKFLPQRRREHREQKCVSKEFTIERTLQSYSPSTIASASR